MNIQFVQQGNNILIMFRTAKSFGHITSTGKKIQQIGQENVGVFIQNELKNLGLE